MELKNAMAGTLESGDILIQIAPSVLSKLRHLTLTDYTLSSTAR